MTTIINQDIEIDLQEVYDTLFSCDRRAFLLDNIKELEDDDLMEELMRRGYPVTK